MSDRRKLYNWPVVVIGGGGTILVNGLAWPIEISLGGWDRRKAVRALRHGRLLLRASPAHTDAEKGGT
jgi:hypothetical protein